MVNGAFVGEAGGPASASVEFDKDHSMIIESTWKHFQVRFPEWLSAVVLTAWGIYLTTHPSMFTDAKTSPLWAGMAQMMSQPLWGMVATLTGVLRMGALYVNGSHSRTPTVRLLTSFFSAFVWTQVIVGLWNAGVSNTGVIAYTGYLVADIYSAFRASGDVTLAARMRKEAEKKSDGSVNRTYA
jgi:hypothetical protein